MDGIRQSGTLLAAASLGTPPVPMVSLDLRDLAAYASYNDDHELVLILTDGEVTVELTGGIVGPSTSAALGARQLASAALAYAARVQRQALSGPD